MRDIRRERSRDRFFDSRAPGCNEHKHQKEAELQIYIRAKKEETQALYVARLAGLVPSLNSASACECRSAGISSDSWPGTPAPGPK